MPAATSVPSSSASRTSPSTFSTCTDSCDARYTTSSCSGSSWPAQAAGVAQHLVQDHAVNTLGGGNDGHPSHVPVPVLAGAIAIRGHAAVRKIPLAMGRLERNLWRQRNGGGDFGALENARPRL